MKNLLLQIRLSKIFSLRIQLSLPRQLDAFVVLGLSLYHFLLSGYRHVSGLSRHRLACRDLHRHGPRRLGRDLNLDLDPERHRLVQLGFDHQALLFRSVCILRAAHRYGDHFLKDLFHSFQAYSYLHWVK